VTATETDVNRLTKSEAQLYRDGLWFDPRRSERCDTCGCLTSNHDGGCKVCSCGALSQGDSR
jgi:hypothetical protein